MTTCNKIHRVLRKILWVTIWIPILFPIVLLVYPLQAFLMFLIADSCEQWKDLMPTPKEIFYLR